VTVREIPGPCPVCGAVSIAPAVQRSTLLAVCSVLTMKALEKLGNHMLRHGSSRSLHRELGGRPWHEAHTLWRASPEQVDRALTGAWDVIPALLSDLGCSGVSHRQVQAMLTDYVHDLARAMAPHSVPALQGYFHRLGLPVYDLEHDLAVAGH
jgi:hypothetical protein